MFTSTWVIGGCLLLLGREFKKLHDRVVKLEQANEEVQANG